MKQLIIISIVLLMGFSTHLSAHSGKAKHHIIIDTDGGCDDFRAICLALASQDFEVLAITTSDGVLHPDNTALKVSALLKELNHEGIPVGKGEQTMKKPPDFRKYAEMVSWGCTQKVGLTDLTSLQIMVKTLSSEPESITMICLGSLTNVAEVLKQHPELKGKINNIIWYNEGFEKKIGFNYQSDIKSADFVMNSGLRMNMICNYDYKNWDWRNFQETVYDFLMYDKLIVAQIKQFANNDHKKNQPELLVDELCILFLSDSSLFMGKKINQGQVNVYHPKSLSNFESSVFKLLTDKAVPRSQVFEKFPDELLFYQRDVQEIMVETIDKYGFTEWRICVLTNELHGHLGIYAVVGAKMGLRAREYYNIGLDEMKIITYAGNNPPISCMNDGLQVSTGSTTGHGLLIISDQKPVIPSADFSFNGNTIRLTLKKDYAEIISNDIRNAVVMYGLESDFYWITVRRLALNYWSNWNRNEIFDIKKIN